MNFNLTEDLSKLTTIPEWQLQKLQQLSKMDICQCILDSLKCCDKFCQIDIGIGKICIGVEGDSVQYKFIPDGQLEDMVAESVSTGKEFLTNDLELSTNMRMLKIYKELM